jgi:hypothetical protein
MQTPTSVTKTPPFQKAVSLSARESNAGIDIQQTSDLRKHTLGGGHNARHMQACLQASKMTSRDDNTQCDAHTCELCCCCCCEKHCRTATQHRCPPLATDTRRHDCTHALTQGLATPLRPAYQLSHQLLIKKTSGTDHSEPPVSPHGSLCTSTAAKPPERWRPNHRVGSSSSSCKRAHHVQNTSSSSRRTSLCGNV